MDSIEEFEESYRQQKLNDIYNFVSHNPMDFLDEFLYKNPRGHVAKKVSKR